MANRHDQARRDALVKTLAKAKEQADNAQLYLSIREGNEVEVQAMAAAATLVDRALVELGAAVKS